MDKIDTMPHITFGSGGGFTNRIRQHLLLPDGQIVEVEKHDTTTYKVVQDIGKKQAKSFFEESQTLKLEALKFNEPGNRYFFLVVKTDSLTENRIVWGNKDAPIDSAVQNFHRKLVNLVRPDRGEEKEHKDKKQGKHQDKRTDN